MADDPRGGSLRDLLTDKGRALFSGRIDVHIGSLGGSIHLTEGQLVDARIGPFTGEPALWRMLLAQAPRLGAEAGRPRTTAGAVLGLPAPLIERFDERAELLARYAEKIGGFDAVWAIRYDMLASRLDELPDAINPLLRLLDGRRNVRQVVVEASLDEILALRILGRLLATGVLEMPANIVVTRPPEPAESVDADGGLEQALLHTLDDPSHDPIPLETRKQPPAPVATPAPAVEVARPAAPASGSSTPPGAMPPPHAAPHARAGPTTIPPVEGALPRSVPPPEKNNDLRVWLGAEEAFFETPDPSLPPGKPPLIVPPPVLVVLVCVAAALGAFFMSRCG